MAFPPEFLDELRNRLTLSEVVGRKVKLIKRGREHSGLCPFHNEKSPSFTVSDEKGFYHCFGCGVHGSAFDFVMNTEGLSFPETVERLAGQAGMTVPQDSPQDRARAEKRAGLIDVLEAAAAWFEEQLASQAGREARDYLQGRGLAPQTVAAFRLGFAPRERGALAKALRARGITVDQLLEAGLVKRNEAEAAGADDQLRDYFFHRVIFPITDRRGRVIAFGGRALGESKAKYLNSPETALFHKGRELYNLARARKAAHDSGELLVTEGYMDVIALAEGGFPAAVAPLGTAVTEDQITALWRLVPEPTLCFDGDTAGQRAAFRAAERAMPLLQAGKSLRFALLPSGEDPDSLLRSQGVAALRTVLEAAQPLAEMVWRKATEGQPSDTPERRAAIRAALRDQVKAIRDPELREDYRQEMDRRFAEAFSFAGSTQGGGQRRDWRPGGRNQGRRGPGRGGWGARNWGPPEAPAKHRGPADLLKPQRTEQLLLATLINHNKLLTEFVETLVGIDFVSEGLNDLRQALIDCFARYPELDSEGVKCHLSEQGYSGVLAGLLASEVYVHGRFARPDASAEVARQSVLHILGVLRERQSVPQLAEETLALATDMTADQLKRVQARQKLRLEEDGRKVDLDHFETMLQRAADKAES
ncbi:DNA primase [Pelagibius litoralis]|uniref:DNA primase n=1 Tax=Pelagibius litoralis TaxID=374515 RepID=A0A967C4V4_9PROT|nr:DNA primase [Pelagibius litoralis]NIA68724.1 DNA primase [Pelagibius litoralis]